MRGTRVVVALSLILGLITSTVAYIYMKNLAKPAQPPSVKTTESVVVALQAIPPRTLITQEMVAEREYPREAVHPGALRRLADAVGQITIEQIEAGEQVLKARLLGPNETLGLTRVIPEGHRAVTVAVNEVAGVAGFVKPGDRVDVLCTIPGLGNEPSRTSTVLQDVLVLAMAQDMERDKDGEPKVTTSATLAVTPEGAQKLALAEEVGVLRLALRPLFSGKAEIPTVTTSDLINPKAAAPVRHTASKPVVKPAPAPAPQPKPRTVEVIRGTEKETLVLDSSGKVAR